MARFGMLAAKEFHEETIDLSRRGALLGNPRLKAWGQPGQQIFLVFASQFLSWSYGPRRHELLYSCHGEPCGKIRSHCRKNVDVMCLCPFLVINSLSLAEVHIVRVPLR